MKCFRFVDFIRAEEYEISKLYRKITNGINIYGVCNFKKCLVFNKEIIIHLKGITSLDLKEEFHSFRCPICDNIIIPLTLGFYLCKYKIEGKKLEYGEIKRICINNKSDNVNMILFYNLKNNNESLFLELKITVRYFIYINILNIIAFYSVKLSQKMKNVI